jgi:hypothetical protein
MTVAEAIEIRDRAIALGLTSCCPQCEEAISRLSKLGTTSDWTLLPSPTSKEPTIGLGQEDAVRYLRRQIGAANVVA